MFVQMIDVFDDAIFEGRAYGNVIEERKVLNVFAQTDAAGVWTHRNSKLCRHQHYGQHFVHARETATIDLTEADRFGLEELFEDHTVLARLARGYADRRQRFGDLCVA